MLTKLGVAHLRALIDARIKAREKVIHHACTAWEMDTDRRVVERDEAADKAAAVELNAYIDTLERP